MKESIEYLTWEFFTSTETNAWILMMMVFSITCITFIITNMNIRSGINEIKEHFGIEEEKESIIKKIERWIDYIRYR